MSVCSVVISVGDMEKCSSLLIGRIENVMRVNSSEKVAELFYHSLLLEKLQVGPTCGFFALETGINFLLNSKSYITVDELLSYARRQQYTNIGECFSANWLAATASHFIPDRIKASASSFFDAADLLRILSSGSALIIVPYDCDKNFEPCERNGQAAHWAIICGFAYTRNSSDTMNKSTIRWFDVNVSAPAIDSAENFHIITYHGKSRHPALWSYDQLRNSNAQLNQPDVRRAEKFRLPFNNNDMLADLRGKCVVLQKIC